MIVMVSVPIRNVMLMLFRVDWIYHGWKLFVQMLRLCARQFFVWLISSDIAKGETGLITSVKYSFKKLLQKSHHDMHKSSFVFI